MQVDPKPSHMNALLAASKFHFCDVTFGMCNKVRNTSFCEGLSSKRSKLMNNEIHLK